MANVNPEHSATPGTPQTATKAVTGAAISFAGTFIFALWVAVQDRTDIDTMSTQQWILVVLGALATSVFTGGFTYQTRNKPTV